MDYFTSDWHLGHSAIIRLAQRPFATVEDMNSYIEYMALKGKKKGDSIYFIGDMGNDKKVIEHVLSEIKRRKIQFYWILGNHDNKLPLTRYRKYCADIQYARTIKRYHVKTYLHHFPCTTWDGSFRNSYHLYGHVHNGSHELERMGQKMTGKALNVNLEFHDYEMWTWNEIVSFMATREDNWDIIEF